MRKPRVQTAHEPTLDSKVREQVRALADSGEFDNDSWATYHITERVRSILGDQSISVSKITFSIPEHKRDFLRGYGHRATLEDFIEVRNFLSEVSPNLLSKYGQAPGIYFLARDLGESGKNIPYLGLLFGLLRTKKRLEDLIGRQPASTVTEWKPNYINLRFRDAEKILAFLRQAYCTSPIEFFARYGAKNGAITLAKDLEITGFNLDPGRISSLINDSDGISTLLGIEDQRFKTEWNPRYLICRYKLLIQILEHLERRYHQHSDSFFELYGSNIGHIILARELRGYSHSNKSVFYLVRNGELLGDIMGIEDERFRTQWQLKFGDLMDKENVEQLIMRGIEHIANGKKLPDIGTPINEELIEYLKFRYHIVRGINKLKRSDVGYSAHSVPTTYTLLHAVNLFAPQNIHAVMAFIYSSNEEDKKTLIELSSVPVPRLESTDTGRIGEFTFAAGRLLYSFDKDVRIQAQWLLSQIGTQFPRYRQYISQGGDIADTASYQFERAIARHDPYHHFYHRENRISSLSNFLNSYLGWARLDTFKQRNKHGIHVSIQTGGFDGKPM